MSEAKSTISESSRKVDCALLIHPTIRQSSPVETPVIVPGRATFLNLSRYSDYAEKTFRRWFRRKVDWAQLNVTAIRAVVPCDHESV